MADYDDLPPNGQSGGLRFRLSVMMFLEFFIWGAWLPMIFGYLPSLGFTAFQSGLILNAFALASFTAMFFSTQFADRNFAGQGKMKLRRDQLFRQRLTGIHMVRVHHVEGELDRGRVSGRNNNVAGRNEIDKGAALRGGVFLGADLLYANQRGIQQSHAQSQ